MGEKIAEEILRLLKEISECQKELKSTKDPVLHFRLKSRLRLKWVKVEELMGPC